MKIGIFVNANRDKDGTYLKGICDILDKKQIEYVQYKSFEDDSKISEDFFKDMNFVLVLGGDGTMLHATRETAKYGIPIFGVNIGHLGFLTGTDYDNFEHSLDEIMNGNYIIEERMLLTCDIDGRYGIIVSSPTGSTGYSLSAGGPIVSPDASCLIVTPICAHSLTSKPLILSDKDVVGVKVDAYSNALIVVDGQRKICFNEKKVAVRVANCKAKYIRLNNYNFFNVLSTKFNNSINYK